MSYLSGVGYTVMWLCGYAAIQLSRHPSPLEYASSKEKVAKWLRSCQDLTSPWYMLVGTLVAMLLHVRGYTVVKTTNPLQNMLVKKEVATCTHAAIFTLYVYSLRQPAFCVSA